MNTAQRWTIWCVLGCVCPAVVTVGQERKPPEDKPEGAIGLHFAVPDNPPAGDRPDIAAAELMAPQSFPNAQYGMRVESAEDGPVAKIVTTGGEFHVRKADDIIECRQRIGAERPVGLLRLPPGTLANTKLTHQSTGAVILSDGKSSVRINGDSLLMVQPGVNGEIVAELLFTPDYHSEYKGNFNFYDPRGGISFFEHGQQPGARARLAKDPVTVSWPWKAGGVFWASVSPPKPYDWKRSVEERHVVYGSSFQRYMYPADISIVRWRPFADVLLLHMENGWENWQLSLIPRDMENYKRVMRTARENGMKVAVYTTPKAFLKGTAIEDRATPDVNDPKATGWPTGSSAKEFLEQATRVVKEFGTDGLYFDEMYATPQSQATSYWLARSSRQLVGDDGPLYYHCTEGDLGDRRPGEMFGRTQCPTVHAYFGLVMKGEAVWDRWDPAYMRYILGTYNLSNTPVIQAMNQENQRLTPKRIDYWLRNANARFFLGEHWFYTGQDDVMREYYWPRLTPDLRREIEADLLRPTQVFEQFRLSIQDGSATANR